MNVQVFDNKRSMGEAAALQAAAAIRNAIRDRGGARIVAATAASQAEFLKSLTSAEGIDWREVEAFHLDEYIGLPITHPGSFRRMLLEQLINKTGIIHYHLLDGDGDVPFVVRNLSETISSAPIDIIFLGIGENAHLAFNDPPADFAVSDPYLIVELDEACRRQQVMEGWFSSVSEVPARAISMSIRQILKAEEIIAIVPDARKSLAVKACLEGDVTPVAPASILRTHPNSTIYLDVDSASLLDHAVTGSV